MNQWPHRTDRIALAGSMLIAVGAVLSWIQHRGEFVLTPDQQGQRLVNQGDDVAAAQTFQDPFRQASAWYRAGDFKKAAAMFSTIPGSDAAFNHGNALVMTGNYRDAITRYDLALSSRPHWEAAQRNREIAAGRAARLEKQGGEMTGGKLAADEIVFDQSESPGGSSDDDQETVLGEEMSDSELQAIWLRQVQTTPRDFLKSKFAYQSAARSSSNIDDETSSQIETGSKGAAGDE